jgi:hypothetical protein
MIVLRLLNYFSKHGSCLFPTSEVGRELKDVVKTLPDAVLVVMFWCGIEFG